jgi:broad specificity phosphatase PhoE
VIENLILVRHGETVLNAAGIAQGWNDSALSDLGQRQVRALAERIKPLGITAIFSSPLGRAMSTAQVIAEATGLPITTLDDLREMGYGEWEGMRFIEVRQQYAEHYAKWVDDPDYACPGGESHRDLLNRMERAFAHIEKTSNDERQRVVVVTHGTAIRVGATSLLGAPLSTARHLAQDNASLNLFLRRGGRLVLKVWNDTTHCEWKDER